MSAIPPPPAHLARFVDLIGVDAAIALFLACGGAQLHLSLRPRGDSLVVRAVGMEAAVRLATHAHLLPRECPVGKPWIAQVWRAQGLPVAQIARNLHATERAVRRWLGAAPAGSGGTPDPRQLRLL